MSKSTIEIPVSIIEENLTLSEIGAVIILLASPYSSWCCKALWDNDRTLSKTIESLRQQGIVTFDEDDHIVIDFKKPDHSQDDNYTDDPTVTGPVRHQ